MMPSPSDSSRSLTSRPSTRGLTHLGLHRPWLQALLTLGLAQVLLGILVVTFSMVASSVTTTESIKRSCPSWAGFSPSPSGKGWVHPVARGSRRCLPCQAEPVPTLSPAGVLRGSWHCVLEAAIHFSDLLLLLALGAVCHAQHGWLCSLL
uniref:Family with sequence similarity 189 member B n=1 Tax=Pipistrellus kuhlii TaxID=59472 RepID=A0A7J7USW6_PIPKU|nr:family with sequence similarity 189 member B [Pipistrellus kuhlii]